jgi:hypothetical protein
VESFLANPLRCVFGNDVTGGITDFITDITDSAISSVMTGAIVPLATEAIWTFSGLAWLETLFTQICSILGIVDSIVDAVQKIGDVVDEIDDIVGSLGSAGGGLISSIGGIFGVSELTLYLLLISYTRPLTLPRLHYLPFNTIANA